MGGGGAATRAIFDKFCEDEATARTFALLFEANPCRAELIDGDGRRLAISEAALESMEIEDPARVIGADWFSCWRGDHEEAARNAVDRAKASGRASFRAFATTLKGAPRWWDVSIARFKAERELYIVLAHDITCETYADERAKLAQRVTPGAATIVVGRQGRASQVSGASVDWLGLDRGEPVLERFEASASRLLAELLSGAIPGPVELHGTRYTVPERVAPEYVDLHAIARLNRGGAVVGLQIYMKSETQREEMRQDLERFFAISPNLMLMLDMEGSILKVNPTWGALLGYELSSMIGRRFIEFVHPDDVQKTMDEFAHLIGSGQLHPLFANRYVKADGSYLWIGWAASVAVDRGTVYATGIDLTRQKKLEARMEHANELLHQHNEQLESFTSMAAHDLQEPLRKVRVFVDRLQRTLESRLEEKETAILERIESAAIRMSQLVEAMLHLSRIARQTPQYEMLPARVFLRAALENVADAVADRGASIEVEGAWDESLEGDAVQLVSLLTNLIHNALKFTRPGVPPRVRARASVRGGAISIEIVDNGIGVDERYASRIFEPFERLHSQTSSYRGTGMGLAICDRIARRYGGSIQVSANPEGGSIFTVTLPRRRSASTIASNEQEASLHP